MTLPLIIPKPSTDMSQMIAGHGCIDTTSQELSRSDPVEFQFLETKEEASVDFVFQSQPVEELNPHDELNIYENQNKPGQVVICQPNSQYLMFDDPCIISHMQVNNSATNSQSIAMVATQSGTPILQNENASNLSMRMVRILIYVCHGQSYTIVIIYNWPLFVHATGATNELARFRVYACRNNIRTRLSWTNSSGKGTTQWPLIHHLSSVIL